MAKSFPKDQFDDYPHDLDRRGAHRSPRKKGKPWLGFLVALLATVGLVAGGLFVVASLNEDVDFGIPGFGEVQPTAAPTASPTPTVLPVLDPKEIDKKRKITITVLNGTDVAGLQDVAGDALADKKWPVKARTTASANDIQKTVVYYSNPDDEDVALGVAAALGIGVARQSDAFPGAPITLVVGADYATAQG